MTTPILPKDVYGKILRMSNFETINSMIAADSRFDKEEVYRGIIEAKYPFMVFQRLENETYKELYLRISDALYKLNRYFQLEEALFINVNPINFWEVAVESRKQAYRDQYTYILKPTEALFVAMHYNALPLFTYLLNKIVSSTHIFLTTVPDWDQIMESAIMNGRLEFVKLLIRHTRRDYTKDIDMAISWGRLNIVKYLIEKLYPRYNRNRGLKRAAEEGSLEVLKYFIQRGATKTDEALLEAVEAGNEENIEVIDYLIGNNLVDDDAINAALEYARDNEPEIANHLRAKLAERQRFSDKKINDIIAAAYRQKRNDVVTHFFKMKDSSLLETIRAADEAGQNEIVDFIMKQL